LGRDGVLSNENEVLDRSFGEKAIKVIKFRLFGRFLDLAGQASRHWFFRGLYADGLILSFEFIPDFIFREIFLSLYLWHVHCSFFDYAQGGATPQTAHSIIRQQKKKPAGPFRFFSFRIESELILFGVGPKLTKDFFIPLLSNTSS
jgi:hypothetical protein